MYILLLCQNAHRFDLPTGEGAPSKFEGVGGVFCGGAGETFPCWVWATPKVFARCSVHRRRRHRPRQSANFGDKVYCAILYMEVDADKKGDIGNELCSHAHDENEITRLKRHAIS